MGELAADRLLAHILHGKEGVVSATTTPRQEFSRPRTMSGGVPGGKFFLRSSIPYAGADTTYFCTKDDATQNVCALRVYAPLFSFSWSFN